MGRPTETSETARADREAPAATAYQGFGHKATGGAGGRTITVTTLARDGPGSFLAALKAKGPRIIVFRVSGTINVNGAIVSPADVTVDGTTAPGEGITIRGGLHINHYKRGGGGRNIIFRGLRFRGGNDSLGLNHTRDVVLDHCSFGPAADGALDIVSESRDITVSWCIFSGTKKANLVGYGAHNISVHHSIYYDCASRNPQGQVKADMDIRNNIVWNFSSYGVRLTGESRGNIVNCFFRGRNMASALHYYRWGTGKVYIRGIMGPDGPWQPTSRHTFNHSDEPIAAPPVETWPVSEMMGRVLAGAGARPLDATDRKAVDAIRAEWAKLRPRIERVDDTRRWATVK